MTPPLRINGNEIEIEEIGHYLWDTGIVTLAYFSKKRLQDGKLTITIDELIEATYRFIDTLISNSIEKGSTTFYTLFSNSSEYMFNNSVHVYKNTRNAKEAFKKVKENSKKKLGTIPSFVEKEVYSNSKVYTNFEELYDKYFDESIADKRLVGTYVMLLDMLLRGFYGNGTCYITGEKAPTTIKAVNSTLVGGYREFIKSHKGNGSEYNVSTPALAMQFFSLFFAIKTKGKTVSGLTSVVPALEKTNYYAYFSGIPVDELYNIFILAGSVNRDFVYIWSNEESQNITSIINNAAYSTPKPTTFSIKIVWNNNQKGNGTYTIFVPSTLSETIRRISEYTDDPFMLIFNKMKRGGPIADKIKSALDPKVATYVLKEVYSYYDKEIDEAATEKLLSAILNHPDKQKLLESVSRNSSNLLLELIDTAKDYNDAKEILLAYEKSGLPLYEYVAYVKLFKEKKKKKGGKKE